MASKGVVGLTGESLVKGIFEQYRDANANYGRELQLGENLALEFGFYIADTQEEAMNRLTAIPRRALQVVRSVSDSFVTQTSTDGSGALRARRPARPSSKTALSRGHGYAALPRTSSRFPS